MNIQIDLAGAVAELNANLETVTRLLALLQERVSKLEDEQRSTPDSEPDYEEEIVELLNAPDHEGGPDIHWSEARQMWQRRYRRGPLVLHEGIEGNSREMLEMAVDELYGADLSDPDYQVHVNWLQAASAVLIRLEE